MEHQVIMKAKQLLSLLLVLLMVCGLFPMGIMAADVVTVSIPNAVSAKLFSAEDTGRTTDLLSGTAPYAVSGLADGSYLLALYDDVNSSLGTIELDVNAQNREFTVYAVSVTCGNDGWVYGTDYNVLPTAVSGGSGVSQRRTVTAGDNLAVFPCMDGDSVSVSLLPSVEKKAEGYAAATAERTVSGVGFASVSAVCEKAGTLYVTYPYADSNEDSANDYELEVGQLTLNFIFSHLIPAAVSAPENGSVTAEFPGLSAGNYYYRVTNPLNNDAVTYGSYTAVKIGENNVAVTAEQMYVGDPASDSDTLVRDFSRNQYDVADLYLSVDGDMTGAVSGYNGASGELRMTSGQTVSLYPYRNWYPVESFSNTKVTQPDFHVQVLNIEGNPVTVTEKTAEDTSKHSYAVEAVSEGTAILLVTYDAMTHDVSDGMGGFFSAIWPENTGVIVVTVDKAGGINSNMTINETLNIGEANKMVIDKYDAELDVLYYTGNDGAVYSFKPEEGTAVTMAVCGYQSGTMTFGSFSDTGVSVSNDGTVTLSGITEGKTIVKLEKQGKVNYQVIRAIHTDVTVKDASGMVLCENSSVVPGDKLTVTYSNIFHPANKLSGIYNMSAAVTLIGSDGTTAVGSKVQYNFAASPAAHAATITVPASAGGTYGIGGTINVSGFGSYYGYHRMLTYENGKAANMTAVQQNGYMGRLPELIFTVPVPVTAVLTVRDEGGTALMDYTAKITDGNGDEVALTGNSFSVYPGKTYAYSAVTEGSPRVLGSFTVPAEATEYTAEIVIPALSAGAWDGTAKTEPEKSEGVYQIGTGAELAWFAGKVNDGTAVNASAALTADINLSNLDWTPIGTSSAAYTGIFDGQGHAVSGLYISGSAGYVGLFGKINGAALKNIAVDGIVNTTAASSYAGGIAGSAAGNSTIDKCVNRADVTGKKFVGGITGNSNGNSVQITNCYNTGNISGTQYVGGIGAVTTAANKPVVTNCYNIGTVYCTSTYCGALFGAGTNAKTTVTNCYYLGDSWAGTGSSNVNLVGTAGTATELKALAVTLGDAYADDVLNVNNGYPVLNWQNPTPAEDAEITVTVSSKGELAEAKDNSLMVNKPVTVKDIDMDGTLTVHEALTAAHEAYLTADGYEAADYGYGLSVSKLWGVDTMNTLFFVNGTGISAGVGTDTVKNGDALLASVNADDIYYADWYTFFSDSSVEAVAGENITLTLKGHLGMAYTAEDLEDTALAGVTVKTADGTELGSTDAKGEVTFSFAQAGTYIVTASGTVSDTVTDWMTMESKQADCPIIAPACVITVTSGSGGPSSGTITVFFTLMGDEAHGEPAGSDDTHTLKDGNLQTWIEGSTLTLNKSATVRNALDVALSEAGAECSNPSGNYVSSITFDGVTLGEFDNGALSGWMYTLNGKHPDLGVAEQTLSDGDVIVFHYTDDYTKEEGSGQWNGDGDKDAAAAVDTKIDAIGKVSLKKESVITEARTAYDALTQTQKALVTKLNVLTEAEAKLKELKNDNNGSGGSGRRSGGSTTNTGTAAGTGTDSDTSTAENNTGTEIAVTSEVVDGEAKAEITGENVAEALKNAENEDVLTVTVDAENAYSVALTLPAEALKTVADADAALYIETGTGTVKLDADTVREAAQGGKSVEVTVRNNEDGSTTFNVSMGGENTETKMKVELPATDGSQVLVMIKEDGTEEIVRKSVIEDGRAYAEIPAGATVKTVDNGRRFDDVKNGAWYEDAVSFASGHELFNGVSETEFAPSAPMTRAMLATVLYRLEGAAADGTNPFTDVADGKWYTDAIIWANDAGIVTGTDKGFEPDANVTREQIATMLYRYVKQLGMYVSGTGSLSAFADGEDTSGWAREAMQWAVDAGLFKGDNSGKLNPKGDATRAEVATLMTRLVELIVK